MSSALVTRYTESPNFETAGCMVTGEPGPGIVFNHIRTLTNEFVFVSDTVITEAFAEISGITPAKLQKLLKADEEVKRLNGVLETMKRNQEHTDTFFARMEEAGLVIRELE